MTWEAEGKKIKLRFANFRMQIWGERNLRGNSRLKTN